MNSVQTQTLSINGDGGGEAYIDFCDGQLCVSVVIEGKQADFHFEPVTLKMFAHAYKLHCEECERRKENSHDRRICNIRNSETAERERL